MSKLLVICGPTATGKTKVALELAKKFNGEIISADSRQVYKYMDIITGKDISQKSKFKNQNEKLKLKNKNYFIGFRFVNNIPVWLVDVCYPNQQFTVSHFVRYVELVVNDIWQRGKLAIVVGGTGFWIKALLWGVDSLNIPPNENLRKKLEKKDLKDLQQELKKIDLAKWLAMNSSDRQNPRRLIRAIEIKIQKSIPMLDRDKNQNEKLKLKIDKLLVIGLKTRDYQSLYQRIDDRVDKRIKQGAENEVKELLKKGFDWNLPSFSATGYRAWQEYFTKKKSLSETIQRWKFDEHGLARRQLTFFKKLENIYWQDIENPEFGRQIEKQVGQWYSKDR